MNDPTSRRPLSQKVSAIRDHHTNTHPDIAAEHAATHFEREAIAIPPRLAVDPTDPEWRQQARRDAVELYRDVATAGGEGMLLRDVATGDRAQQALKELRGSGCVEEFTRPVPHPSTGRVRQMKALRVPSTPAADA